jgi:hypothetical protein
MYWAHLIVDSTVGQVLAWMKNLVMRREVPPSLRLHVWIARILAFIAVLVIVGLPVMAALDPKSAVVSGGALAVIVALVGVLWKLFKQPGTKLFTGFLGDAARYFQPKPANIARRQEIREAGVRLLERMHESGDYQRIVIAAHSLGSAIAYDILTFAWNRFRKQHGNPDSRGYAAIRAVEDSLEDGKPLTVEGARKLQYAAWQEHRRNTQPWLVTDLITMGSPLTHGPYLMADGGSDFSSLIEDRIYPTCPPKAQGIGGRPRFSYAFPNRSTDGIRHGTFIVPDHGALFAFTRWTNLYFPKHGFIGGDPVGGPLQPYFGHWIADRPIKTRKAGFMGFAHTYYWDVDDRAGDYVGPPGEDHLVCLRDALDLHADGRMRAIARQIPAYTYLGLVPPDRGQD